MHEALHGQMWLNYIMKYITYLGEFGLGPILCGAVLLLFKKTRWAGVAIAIAMALAVAFLVALSRIYLCMHYPSDVLGGLLIGSVCGVAGYFLMRPLKKFIEKKRGKADSPNEAEETQKE